jgi:hypothetical protein
MRLYPEVPRQPNKLRELRVEIHGRLGQLSSLYFVCVPCPSALSHSSDLPSLYLLLSTHPRPKLNPPVTTPQTRISISLPQSQSPTTSLIALASSQMSS